MDKEKVLSCLEDFIEIFRKDPEWEEEVEAVKWAISYIRGEKQ